MSNETAIISRDTDAAGRKRLSNGWGFHYSQRSFFQLSDRICLGPLALMLCNPLLPSAEAKNRVQRDQLPQLQSAV
jgi:hypothetical protein